MTVVRIMPVIQKVIMKQCSPYQHLSIHGKMQKLRYSTTVFRNIACGLDLSFEPWLYVAVFALIMICYFVINRVLVGRLKKMTPAEVLKNRE